MDIYCCSYTISTVKPNPWQRGSKNPKFGQASFMDAPFRLLHFSTYILISSLCTNENALKNMKYETKKAIFLP